MIFFAALVVLSIAGTTLLVFAGREFLSINGFPPHRIHGVGDVVHLASLGYSALNDASNRAARRRMTRS